MKREYEFFIAGKTRNKDNILKICDMFDKYNMDLVKTAHQIPNLHPQEFHA